MIAALHLDCYYHHCTGKGAKTTGEAAEAAESAADDATGSKTSLAEPVNPVGLEARSEAESAVGSAMGSAAGSAVGSAVGSAAEATAVSSDRVSTAKSVSLPKGTAHAL